MKAVENKKTYYGVETIVKNHHDCSSQLTLTRQSKSKPKDSFKGLFGTGVCVDWFNSEEEALIFCRDIENRKSLLP